MEDGGNGARGRIGDYDQKQDPQRLEIASDGPRYGTDDAKTTVSRSSGEQGSTSGRQAASWVSWQSALYVFVLGAISFFIAPITSLWWIVPVLGALVPIALTLLDRPILTSGRSIDRKRKERELLQALAEIGELTPTTAAMRTSLTIHRLLSQRRSSRVA